jgi:hypothetical protein
MAFRDFAFPEVQQALGLTLSEADLFSGVPALELPASFTERMRSDIALALAINTEKARSEFIIAPVLAELRRLLGGRFGLFSGVEFDVDASRGLNGYCDFILTRSPLQSVLSAPVVAIAEAKDDNLRTGMGQCIAAMVAAWEFNARSAAVAAVHGAVPPAVRGNSCGCRVRTSPLTWRSISSPSWDASWVSWHTSSGSHSVSFGAERGERRC